MAVVKSDEAHTFSVFLFTLLPKMKYSLTFTALNFPCHIKIQIYLNFESLTECYQVNMLMKRATHRSDQNCI